MTKKKKIAAIVSVLTVATLAVGATLAYLNDTTETVTNTFASDKNISISLREPKWDGYTFEDTNYPAGTAAKTDSNELGFNQAKSYVPGQVIPKNPTVKNTGTTDSVDAYIALRVEYYDNDNNQISYDTFKTNYLEEPGIQFGTEWALTANPNGQNKNDQIFIYSEKNTVTPQALEVGKTAQALFENVPLSLNLEPGKDGKLPKFKIKVTAYAIQKNEIGTDIAAAKLLEFVNQQ